MPIFGTWELVIVVVVVVVLPLCTYCLLWGVQELVRTVKRTWHE